MFFYVLIAPSPLLFDADETTLQRRSERQIEFKYVLTSIFHID